MEDIRSISTSIINRVCKEHSLGMVNRNDSIIIRGGAASGKTGAAIKIMVEYQKLDKNVWYFDLEGVKLFDRLNKLGFDYNKGTVFSSPQTENDILNFFKALSDGKMRTPDIVIIDPLTMIDLECVSTERLNIINYLDVIEHIIDVCEYIGFKPFIVVTMQKSRKEL
jgi:RecA/RadA recombinase